MPRKSVLTAERVAWAMEETDGVAAWAAALLGVEASTLRKRQHFDPAVKQIFEFWKTNPRYWEAIAKMKRENAIRANRTIEKAKATTEPRQGPVFSEEDLAKPLDWWEKVIINRRGLRAMLTDMIVVAAHDLKSKRQRDDAAAFFESQWYRTCLEVLDMPSTLKPRGYSCGADATD